MKRSVWIFGLIVLPLLGYSQLISIRKDFKWGFANMKGEVVISPKYDAVNPFNITGFATIEMEGKIGLINEEGDEEILPRYDEIKELSRSLFLLKNNGSYRLYSVDHHKMNALKFDSLDYQKSTICAYQDGKTTVFDLDGNIRLKAVSGTVSGQGAYLFVHQKGFLDIYLDKIIHKQVSAEEFEVPDKGYLSIKNDGYFNVFKIGKGEVLNSEYDEVYADFLNDKPVLVLKANGKFGVYGEGLYIKPVSEVLIEAITDFYSIQQNNQNSLVNSWGTEVISLGFEKLYRISDDGFMAFTVGEKYGLAHETGGVIKKATYDLIENFKGETALVKRRDLFGLLNKKGVEVVPSKYENCTFSKKSAKFYSKDHTRWVSFDANKNVIESRVLKNLTTVELSGKRNIYQLEVPKDEIDVKSARSSSLKGINDFNIITIGTDSYSLYSNGSFLVGIKKNGIKITNPSFWKIHLEDLIDGQVARAVYEGGRHCLISRKGKSTFKMDYLTNRRMVGSTISFIGRFSEDDLAPIYLGGYMNVGDRRRQKQEEFTRFDAPLKSGVWGFINREGRLVVNAQFKNVYPSKYGAIIAKKSKGWGAVDLEGKELVPFKFSTVEYMVGTDEITFYVTERKLRYGFLNSEGRELCDLEYYRLGKFSEGMAAVKVRGGWSYVNAKGVRPSKDVYQRAKPFQGDLAAVRVNNRWGFIDKQMQWVIEPMYQEAGSFSENRAPVKLKSLYGYVNAANEWVLAPKYRNAKTFHEGMAAVKKNSKWTFIDVKGNRVIRKRFKKVEVVEGGHKVFYGSKSIGILKKSADLVTKEEFNLSKKEELSLKVSTKEKYSLRRFSYGGLSVFVDSEGHKVFNREFNNAEPFYKGLAVVGERQDQYINYGIINDRGVLMTSFNYDNVTPTKEGFFEVSKNRFYGMYNFEGEKLLGAKYESIKPYGYGLYQVMNGGKVGYITAEGEWIIGLSR